jgi:hypothetical protein
MSFIIFVMAASFSARYAASPLEEATDPVSVRFAEAS